MAPLMVGPQGQYNAQKTGKNPFQAMAASSYTDPTATPANPLAGLVAYSPEWVAAQYALQAPQLEKQYQDEASARGMWRSGGSISNEQEALQKLRTQLETEAAQKNYEKQQIEADQAFQSEEAKKSREFAGATGAAERNTQQSIASKQANSAALSSGLSGLGQLGMMGYMMKDRNVPQNPSVQAVYNQNQAPVTAGISQEPLNVKPQTSIAGTAIPAGPSQANPWGGILKGGVVPMQVGGATTGLAGGLNSVSNAIGAPDTLGGFKQLLPQALTGAGLGYALGDKQDTSVGSVGTAISGGMLGSEIGNKYLGGAGGLALSTLGGILGKSQGAKLGKMTAGRLLEKPMDYIPGMAMNILPWLGLL